jgi:hypothetical protein
MRAELVAGLCLAWCAWAASPVSAKHSALWACEEASSFVTGPDLRLEIQGLQDEAHSRTLDYFQHLLHVVDVTVEAPEAIDLLVEHGGGLLPGLEAFLDILPASVAASGQVQSLRPCISQPPREGTKKPFLATCRVSPYVVPALLRPTL